MKDSTNMNVGHLPGQVSSIDPVSNTSRVAVFPCWMPVAEKSVDIGSGSPDQLQFSTVTVPPLNTVDDFSGASRKKQRSSTSFPAG